MKRKGEEGVAAIEFAILLPVLLLLLLGMMEFGLALWNQEMMTNATREAARAGIVADSPRLTQAEVRTVLENNLSIAGIDSATATITITGTQGISGSPLSVRVVYPYQYLVLDRFISALGATVNLTAQTVMFNE